MIRRGIGSAFVALREGSPDQPRGEHGKWTTGSTKVGFQAGRFGAGPTKTMVVKGPQMGGLLVHRGVSMRSSPSGPPQPSAHGAYGFTHVASGKWVGPQFRTMADAKLAVERLTAKHDFTRSVKDIVKDEGLKNSLRAMKDSGPRGPHGFPTGFADPHADLDVKK